MAIQINKSTRKQKLTREQIFQFAEENGYTVDNFGIENQVLAVRYTNPFDSSMNQIIYFDSFLIMQRWIQKNIDFKKSSCTISDCKGIKRRIYLDSEQVYEIEIKGQKDILTFCNKGDYYYLESIRSNFKLENN